MQKDFIQHLRLFAALNDHEAEICRKYLGTSQLKKKQYLLQEGRVCNSVYFVEKGCLKMSYVNKKGTEQITQFALDGWWISDYQSFLNSTPSEYNIQAVEESKIVFITSKMLDNMIIEVPQAEKYFRRIMQEAIAGAQLRSKLLYEMSKEEFYFHFSTQFPAFMQRVPQYMIASYLGLTPEYLSELRKKNS